MSEVSRFRIRSSMRPLRVGQSQPWSDKREQQSAPGIYSSVLSFESDDLLWSFGVDDLREGSAEVSIRSLPGQETGDDSQTYYRNVDNIRRLPQTVSCLS